MDEDMAKVKVTRDITVVPNQTSTVLYKPRDEPYTAPRAHIEQIVNAGAGERVEQQAPAPAAQAAQQPAAPKAAATL